MKESSDYLFLKTISNKYVIPNYFNNIKNFKLDNLNLFELLSIIESDIKKTCNYIEQKYLENKFNEDMLIQILDKLIYPPNQSKNEWILSWIPIILYFKKLPLYIYLKVIQKNINMFENISREVNNYNEIEEYYKFLKL